MKTFITILLLTLVVNYSQRAMASETNATYLKILEASNNVQSVISALPDVEKLWPQDPDTYLKSVSQAAHILGDTRDNPNAKQSLLNLFDSMMQKSCPTNEEQATTWIKLKQDVVLYCLGPDKFRNNKSSWLEMAKFIGEVRSQIIPNYKTEGVLLNGMDVTPEEIAQNQKNMTKDELQARLRQTNNILTFQLLYNCAYLFPSSNPTNVDFSKEIISAAHLTDDEIRKLKGGGF
jgi:hypothetical protein